MSGAILPLPLYALTASTEKTTYNFSHSLKMAYKSEKYNLVK
jgi:hypothetical protein